MKINKKLLMAALASAVIVSAPQVKTYTLSNAESVATNTGIGLSEEKPQAAVRAPQEETDPNYAEDEKKVGTYKETQLERGNGPAFSITNEASMDYKDGFRYSTLEPGADSSDKTKWGIEMEFDKEKGQRTYTDFGFTNTGNMGAYLNPGNIPANDVGVKVAEKGGFKEANYKAESEIIITGARVQRNLNLYATVGDLAYINSIENKNTTMGWKSDYSKDASNQINKATQGGSSAFSFTVNPWPNENDQLDLITLSGEHTKREFVNGQKITTGIKVANLDDNARERLVGQVYHPETGEIVPEAKAYIDEKDNVVVEMPKGAVNEDGTINEDSIFYKNSKYKGIQNLEVKFFARPRTAEEFKAISDEANYGEGNYTSTGAGTETINHKGQDVVIDKQGIARYDHYNLIGKFNLNIDDTAFHDQTYRNKDIKTGKIVDTSSQSAIGIRRGETLDVDNQTSKDEMDGLVKDKNAHAKIDKTFFDKENAGKDPDDQWKLKYNPELSNIEVTAPKYAKAGSYVALPITYTYTNGSTDVKTFFFVVQDDNNKIPEYETQVAYPQETQKSLPSISQEEKDKDKLPPVSYSIPEGTEFKDDHGNEWNVSIDETTGEITATPKDPSNFNGGERLKVPVVAHYENKLKPELKITEDVRADFVIKERFNKTPNYNAKAGKAGDILSSDVIINKDDKYNRDPGKFTIESNTYTDDKGNTWVVAIDQTTGKVTATVPNPEDGKSIDGAIINVPVTAYYYEKDGKEVGTRQVDVQFIATGTTGTYEKTIEIPFDTKVEKNPDLKKGEIKVITEGKVGSKKITYTIKDSKVIKEEETDLIYPQDRLIQVGEGVNDGTHEIKEKSEVPYEIEIEFSDDLKPGEQEVVQEGVPGEKTRTTTLTIEDGKVTKTEVGDFEVTKQPVKKIIKVGRNTEGEVKHVEEIPFKYTVNEVDTLKKGEYEIVKPGKVGSKTTTWKIENSKIVGEPKTETVEAEDAIINVGKGTNEGTHEVTEKVPVPFETIIEFDDSLAPGEQKVTQEGEPGEKTRTTTLTIEDGKVTKTEAGEFEQNKAPVNRIIKVGRNTDGEVVHKEEIPFKYTVEYDPELKAGEYRVETPGRNGERITTWTIKNSKVDGDPKVVETKPIDAVIKVGNKDFTGEFKTTKTEAVEFETEYKVNNELKPGEVKVVQDGELGEKETPVTHTIVNGEVTKSEEGETKQTKAPVKRIVEVGPGTTDGTHTYTNKIPFDVEVRVNPELKKGESKVVQKGEVGEEEYTITIENSKVTKTSDPVVKKEAKKEIIEVGSQEFEGEVKHTEELPFGYKVEEVEDLKKGEYRIVKPGKVGTKTTTWTIKDSQVVGEPKEEIVEAEDALIQVGKGTNDGTHEIVEKKELPFETRYEYDDSLEPGEEKIVQEGKPGLQERTNTLVIKDGKVTEVKEGEFKTITEPEERIVKIGRKSTEGETTKTIEREIPYETKVIYDENLEAGFQKIENEGKPGKEEVTITQKIKDSKPVGDPTETTKTITEKEDRVVRIGVKPVVKEVELGHDTEYRHNPELKEGETKVIEEGSNGSVKYTTTFNKETGKLEVKEERTEPKNKVVEYGSKTDGEFTYESEKAYDIIIRENPNLEAGKTKVIQEGIVGKTETTVKIENSKEVDRTTKTITEKQDKIIEIGTKNVCEIPPVKPGEDPKDPDKPGDKDPEKPDKPGDKDPENPDQPGGEDPKDPDQPGGEDPKDPDQPGGEDPKDPDQPGEDPKDPEKPGKPGEEKPGKPGEEKPGKPGDKDPDQPGEKDPKDPETPGGKDPKDPETPGGKDPKDPGKDPGKTPEENGKTPENNGKTPENNGKTPENNGKTPGATGQVDGKSTTTNNKTPKRLPKSGSESEIITLAMSGLLAAAGFIGLKKKRKDQ